MRIVLSAAAALSLAACGNQPNKVEQPAQEQIENVKIADESVEAPAEKPGMIVVRVKEDANGVASDADQDVTMSAVATAEGLTEDSVEAVFATGQVVAPEANGDALDGDSSEGQYRWGYARGYGRGFYRGYNRGFNRGYYGGWGHNHYRYNYRPYYLSRGYGWSYGYRNYYRRGGYGYYCYW